MKSYQLRLLRTLIQGEIEYANQVNQNFRGSFDQEEANDQGWEQLIESVEAPDTYACFCEKYPDSPGCKMYDV